MAITFVGQVVGTIFNTTLTKAYSSTAGNTLILSLQHQSFTSPTITDTAGNTYVQGPDTSVDGTGAVAEKMVGLWYVFNALPITSITVTTSGAGSKAIQLNLSEWRGIASLRDKSSAYIGSSPSPTMYSAVATVSAQAGDLVIGDLGYYDGTARDDSLVSGYTALTGNTVSTTYQSTAYRIVTTTAAAGPSYTFARNAGSGVAIASFVPAAVKTIAVAATATYNPTGSQNPSTTGAVIPVPSGAVVGQYVIAAVFFAQGTGPASIVTPANWTVLTPAGLTGTSANRVTVLYGYAITNTTSLSNLGTSFLAKVGYSATRVVAITHLMNNVDLNTSPSIGLIEFSASAASSVTFNSPASGDYSLYFPATNSSAPTPNAVMTSTGGTKNVQVQSLDLASGSSSDSQLASMTGGTGVTLSASVPNHVSFGVGFMAAFGVANIAPTAAFTHSEAGLTTSVDGTTSVDPDGTIVSYDWDWGDSTTRGNGPTSIHTYVSAGTHTVVLTVTDNGGLTGTASSSMTVTVPTRPIIVGTPTTGVQIVSTAYAVTIAKPTGIADGDWLIACLRNQDGYATSDFALSGWARVGPAFVANSAASRDSGYYAKYIPTASAETATSYTFVWTGSGSGGRAVGVIIRVQGADPVNLIDAFASSYSSTPITNGQKLVAYAVPDSNGLQLAIAMNEQVSPNASETVSVTSGFALVQSVFSSTGTAVSRTTLELYQKSQDAGYTTEIDVTWVATASSNIQSIVLKGIAVSPSPVPHFGTGDYAIATSGAATAITVSKPTSTADGDLLVAYIYNQTSAGSNFTTVPTGWTLAYALSIRRGGVYTKPIPSAATETATTYTWSGTTGSGRIVATIFRVTGADATTPIDVIGAELSGDAPTASSITVPSLTPTQNNDLLLGFNYWNNSSPTIVSVYSAAPGMTDGIQGASPTGGAANTSGTDIQYQALTTIAASGTRVPTLSPSGVAANGFLLTIRSSGTGSSTEYVGIYRDGSGVNHPGSLFYWNGTAKVSLATTLVNIFQPTTVSQFLSPAHLPWFSAHRGFSSNYPEETLYAYRSATDWGIKAIEVSVQYSSDGTPWCFHDPTTTRTTGVTGTISSMTDAQISVLNNLGSTASINSTQPSRPTAKFVDMLNAYYKTHVIIVEDKTYTHTTSMLDLLDSYSSVGRPASEIFIWKLDGLAGSTFYTAAAARGYHRWAYIFDSGMSGSFNGLVTSGKADLIGMDYNSSDATLSAAITACVANGVMPTGHIITSTTQRDRLLGLGMKGLMMSNKDAVPPWYNTW